MVFSKEIHILQLILIQSLICLYTKNRTFINATMYSQHNNKKKRKELSHSYFTPFWSAPNWESTWREGDKTATFCKRTLPCKIEVRAPDTSVFVRKIK
jgi:hypothetical protein